MEKYARQNGNLPQIGMKIKIFETTIQFWVLEKPSILAADSPQHLRDITCVTVTVDFSSL